MVDYLHGRLRLDADYENNFAVSVTNEKGESVEGRLILAIDDLNILGTYDAETECFEFNIPANTLSGTHEYRFVMDGEPLIFPDKIDFI